MLLTILESFVWMIVWYHIGKASATPEPVKPKIEHCHTCTCDDDTQFLSDMEDLP
jgi:hypothetical protein